MEKRKNESRVRGTGRVGGGSGHGVQFFRMVRVGLLEEAFEQSLEV